MDNQVGSDAVRRSLSPRTRFDVFKRDGFTCRYCGRKTPHVVLQVDHVIPVVEGGGDDMDNLVTACWECNNGKSGNLLSEIAPVTDIEDQTISMLERERQLREYNEVKRLQREREDDQIDELTDFWNDLARGRFHQKPIEAHTMRAWLRKLPCEEIKDYMEIAMAKAQAYGQFQYLCAIIRNVTQGN